MKVTWENAENGEIIGREKTKHTPGPWRFSFESTDPEWAVITALRGICVANVNADTRQEANARLIAAAPDLLEACKAALKEMQSFRAYWTGPTMNLAKTKALAEELCEGAIQKAEAKS